MDKFRDSSAGIIRSGEIYALYAHCCTLPSTALSCHLMHNITGKVAEQVNWVRPSYLRFGFGLEDYVSCTFTLIC